MKKKYLFYYEMKTGEKIAYLIKDCQRPESTKVWRILIFNLINEDQIKKISYIETVNALPSQFITISPIKIWIV
jgi:hypothetical protein